jgi:hypothetical protein
MSTAATVIPGLWPFRLGGQQPAMMKPFPEDHWKRIILLRLEGSHVCFFFDGHGKRAQQATNPTPHNHIFLIFFGMDFYGHRVTVSRWDRSSIIAHEIHDSFHLTESQIVDIRHRVGSDKKYRWAFFGCVFIF